MSIKRRWSNRSWTGEDSAFYQSRKWRKARKSYIDRNPLCELCGQFGITSPGEIVDHIVSRKVSQQLEMEELNLQTLCNSCHFQKTAQTRNLNNLAHYVNEIQDGKLAHITPPERKEDLITLLKREGLI